MQGLWNVVRTALEVYGAISLGATIAVAGWAVKGASSEDDQENLEE